MSNAKNYIYANYPAINDNILVSEAIRKLISFQLSRSLKKSIENKFESEEYIVEWICYTCQAKIKINTKELLNHDEELSTVDFLCDAHKDEKINKRISISWIRYENAFHKKLQNLIKSKY